MCGEYIVAHVQHTTDWESAEGFSFLEQIFLRPMMMMTMTITVILLYGPYLGDNNVVE